MYLNGFHEDSKGNTLARRMSWFIRVLAGRTGDCVGFIKHTVTFDSEDISVG